MSLFARLLPQFPCPGVVVVVLCLSLPPLRLCVEKRWVTRDRTYAILRLLPKSAIANRNVASRIAAFTLWKIFSRAGKQPSMSQKSLSQDPAPGTSAPFPQSQSVIDAEIAARKRQEIGLSPRRATQQSEVQRPPDKTGAHSSPLQWLIIGALSLVALLLVYLIVARFVGAPAPVASLQASVGQTISQRVDGALNSISSLGSNPAALLGAVNSLPVRDDFSDESSSLVRDFQPRRWSMGAVPSEGVYRIRMWPGVIAWSTLGVAPTTPYRLATRMTVSNETPWGYGGLLSRYSDERNFLFAQVDGKGRYRFQMQQAGVWSTLQDWTEAAPLKTAGLPNDLVLEDNGDFAILYANGEAIYTSPSLGIPSGDAGVLAGSLDPAVAEANFDWVEISAIE